MQSAYSNSTLAALLVLVACFTTGCAEPTSYTTASLQSFDKDTDYAIDERSDGFSVTVNYSRYQMIPESDAVLMACRSALTSVAYDIGQKRGKKIEQINEQTIRVSMGRNGMTGMTSCSATVPVRYQA